MNQLLTVTTKHHTTTKTTVVISQTEAPRLVEVSQSETQTNSRRKETGAPLTTFDGGHKVEKNTRRRVELCWLFEILLCLSKQSYCSGYVNTQNRKKKEKT
jgi:hypothetical protein